MRDARRRQIGSWLCRGSRSRTHRRGSRPGSAAARGPRACRRGSGSRPPDPGCAGPPPRPAPAPSATAQIMVSVARRASAGAHRLERRHSTGGELIEELLGQGIERHGRRPFVRRRGAPVRAPAEGWSTPRNTGLGCSGNGSSSTRRKLSVRARSTRSAISASVAASVAPRQWCGPRPNARCRPGFRVTSKTSGRSKTASSRLAEASHEMTMRSGSSAWPWSSTGRATRRGSSCTGDA